MPNDHGLRRCDCGNYFVKRDLVKIGHIPRAVAPAPSVVQPDELLRAIECSNTFAVEIAARLDYWQELNHPYRAIYSAHRDREEATHKANWEAKHPDKRNYLQRSLKSDRIPKYSLDPNREITFPAFRISEAHRNNSMTLIDLLVDARSIYPTELVELNREIGNFAEAERLINLLDSKDFSVFLNLTRYLINREESAVVRYRI